NAQLAARWFSVVAWSQANDDYKNMALDSLNVNAFHLEDDIYKQYHYAMLQEDVSKVIDLFATDVDTNSLVTEEFLFDIRRAVEDDALFSKVTKVFSLLTDVSPYIQHAMNAGYVSHLLHKHQNALD